MWLQTALSLLLQQDCCSYICHLNALFLYNPTRLSVYVMCYHAMPQKNHILHQVLNLERMHKDSYSLSLGKCWYYLSMDDAHFIFCEGLNLRLHWFTVNVADLNFIIDELESVESYMVVVPTNCNTLYFIYTPENWKPTGSSTNIVYTVQLTAIDIIAIALTPKAALSTPMVQEIVVITLMTRTAKIITLTFFAIMNSTIPTLILGHANHVIMNITLITTCYIVDVSSILSPVQNHNANTSILHHMTHFKLQSVW